MRSLDAILLILYNMRHLKSQGRFLRWKEEPGTMKNLYRSAFCFTGTFAVAAMSGKVFGESPQGMAWETSAIQVQIDVAAAKGGGRVTVKKGVHPCRTLYLKSGVELHLEEGAVLMGGAKPDDYDDVIPSEMVYRYGDTNMTPTVTRKAFLFADCATNVAITGKGMIDLQGPEFFDHNTTLWGCFWAKPPLPRPRAVMMYRCQGIRMEGVTFKDCPLWTMWLRLCEDIVMDGISIDAEQKMINSDGIDFDGCCHVRLGNSFFKTGDDCVVLRAIRDELRRDVPIVTEDVIVSNCVFNTPCQGVRIGCPSDDTIRNAVFRDIEFHGRNAIGSQQPRHYLTMGDNGYLKTENILFENWKIESRGCPLELFVGENIKLRDFGHMTFRNFVVKSDKPFVIRGNEQLSVVGMKFENIKGMIHGRPFDMAYATDVSFGEIEIGDRN